MSLYIERTGRGPVPLVLIHGWAMHGGLFAPLVESLRETCTLYVVDLPGHGHSRGSALPLEPRTVAAAIAAEVPPAFWLGWSMGGLFALTAALDLPDRVLGMAQLCATPRFVRGEDWPYGNPAAMVRQLAQDLETDYRATLERFMALEAMGSADPRAELRRLRAETFARGEPELRVLQEGIRLLESCDLRDRLPSLAMPSAWITGRRDRLVHPAAMQWSAERAGGRFVEIPHAGHAPFIGHAGDVAAALGPLFAGATEAAP